MCAAHFSRRGPYPYGLRGTEIPIGARILSVVDCFDALTSDRPYRSALRPEDAIKVLSERRGLMYDPDVVDVFNNIHRDITPVLEQQPEMHNAIRRICSNRTTSVADRARAAATEPTEFNSDILAFVSLGRLASRTPTYNDIGSLAWSHLSPLSPGATLALYSMDRSRMTIVAAFSVGPESARVANHAITVGERVSGWAAATARPAVNADADLDLLESTPALRFATAVPLQIDQVVVGVMTFYTEVILPDDSRLKLELIAPHLASLIRLAQLNEREQLSPAAPGATPRLQLLPRRSAR